MNRPSLGLLDLSIDHISIFNNGLKSIVKEQSISSLQFHGIFHCFSHFSRKLNVKDENIGDGDELCSVSSIVLCANIISLIL